MRILDSEHKRKSAIITAIILLLLIFGVFTFGLRYLDPPVEYGVAINLGDANFGKGKPVEKVKKNTAKKEKTEEKTPIEKVEKAVTEEKTEPKKEEIQEDILTNEKSEEIPVVKKKEEKKAEKPEKKPKKEENKKVIEKPKPKPSKATTDALNSLLNGGNSDEGRNKGEGDDTKPGVKGDKNGNPKSTKYYGNTGGGLDGNYNLAGRKALSKPIEKPNCEEEGTVVVSIEVDKNGKVIKAIPGVKGSTNTSPCLLQPAKEAALKTKWNPDINAPDKQRGTIIYKFSLSK